MTKARTRRGLLLFDFDGTVYRGDAPFREYAARIADSLAPRAREPFLQRVARHLAGGGEVEASDNWDAVAKLARPLVCDRSVLQSAFRATREYMMSDACRLEVPEPLVPFLARVRDRVLLAVASNSPEAACRPLLRKIGLGGAFDEVWPGAHKPAGLLPLIDAMVTRHGLPQGEVASIGDHYLNDIAPAREAGYWTAYISPFRYLPGPASVTGTTLEDVLPAAEAWVDGLA